MRSRHDIIEIFSTYVRFDADRFNGWLSDLQLKRSQQNVASVSVDSTSKNAWGLYWYKQWKEKTNRLASQHLLAYLQEAAYWAAYSYADRFQHKLQQFTLADCFQIAIAKMQSALEQFQPSRGTTVESFSKRFFKSTVANTLRLAGDIDVCSDWSFLRRVAKVRLKEALQSMALSPDEIEQYLLMWKCFKLLYAPQPNQGVTRLTKPDAKTLAAIAALYNQEKTSQLTAIAPAIDAATIDAWLQNCIQWGRQYLYPNVASLDMPKPGQSSGSRQDYLPADGSNSLLDNAIAEQALSLRQQQQKLLDAAIYDAIKKLKEPGETLLQMSYQQGLKQREIAEQLGIKQYQVCRKLGRSREELLKLVVQWSQRVLGAEPTPDGIEQMESLIEDWLEEKYAKSTLPIAT